MANEIPLQSIAFESQSLNEKGYYFAPKDECSNKQIIHQLISEGIAIKKTAYGYGLFATKFFAKGSSLYVGNQVLVPNEQIHYLLCTDQGQFEYNTERHAVQISSSHRWLYLFDSFMNHSCDPTTISEQTDEELFLNIYRTVAIKDIHVGDEITCDYNLFEYDCPAKLIDNCFCKATSCIGRVAGFRYLSEMEQRDRLEFVEEEVLENMHADASNRFLYFKDLQCPEDKVHIEHFTFPDLTKGYKMIASKDFQPDELIFTNHSLLYPEDYRIVVEVAKQRVWLNPLRHTINRGKGQREFFYFDTFQNHSCDPNSEMKYISTNQYELRAKKFIGRGEEITSDYEDYDDQLDGTVFQCLCGSTQCRGNIHG